MMTAVLLALIPPPPERTGDVCTQPIYASDKFVCETPILRVLDAQVTQLARAKATENSSASFTIEPQDAWFRRSRLCATKTDQITCLREAYYERLAILRAAGSIDIRKVNWYGCKGRSESVAASTIGVRPVKRSGIIYLAYTAPKLTAWKPWAWSVGEPPALTIAWLEGKSFRCRIEVQ